jgi:hypothetical protein
MVYSKNHKRFNKSLIKAMFIHILWLKKKSNLRLFLFNYLSNKHFKHYSSNCRQVFKECFGCLYAWMVSWLDALSILTISSAFQAMLLPTTLYQDLLTWWRCHIIDGSMGKQVKICSITNCLWKEGEDGTCVCMKVFYSMCLR